VYQINVLVSTILASMLPEGSVSYLYYADRLLQFPLGIFAVALGTAALPSFSSLVAKKNFAGLQEGLFYSLRLMNFVTLPAALGLMVVSVPVFALLFQRGAFDSGTTAQAAQAAGVIGFFTFLSRIVGLLRDIVIGYLFGAHGAADAFFIAFRIPNLLRRLTAEGALSAGFVPVFTDYLTNRSKEEALKVAQIVFTFAVVFLASLTVFGIIFASPLTHLFAPGFLASEGKFRLTVLLTRMMFPYIFFVSLVALAMGFLNSFRHFMAPALSPVLLNTSIIVCALLISPFASEPVVSLGYGVILGGIAQLSLQIPYLHRYGVSISPDFHFRHPANDGGQSKARQEIEK